MFQMGGIGPMFGQVGFFHKFAGKDYEDKRPRDRYVDEARRLLGVLDGRLAGQRLDHRRRLLDRRHRHLPLDPQPDRLLRRRRAGRHRRLRPRAARARRVPRAAGGGARPEHPGPAEAGLSAPGGTEPRARRMPRAGMGARTPGEVRIGISGWRYAPWRGVFYPPGLAQRRELDVRVAHAADDRDQRLVLLAAAARALRRVARRRRPTTSCSRSRARATSRTC